MKHSEVKSLYKYRPINEFTLDIIANSRVYYPTADKFNDPYDSEYFISGKELSEKDLKQFFERFPEISQLDTSLIDKHINALNENINQRIKSAGILSLAEDPSNLLMWAHYSDDHKGVCIEFERHENNLLGNEEATKKVNYTKYYPSISKSAFLKANGLDHFRRVLWTKSEQWRYENEWRTIIIEGGQVINIPGEIKSITFGMRCSQISIDIVKQLVKGKDIQLRLAEKLTSKFGIKFKNISN